MAQSQRKEVQVIFYVTLCKLICTYILYIFLFELLTVSCHFHIRNIGEKRELLSLLE